MIQKAGNTRNRRRIRRALIGLAILIVVAAAGVWYIFNEKFEDTSAQKPAYEVPALQLMNAFRTDNAAANKKYADQLIEVSGTVSEIDLVDTTANIKIADTITGDYINFTFQQKDIPEARNVKAGDNVVIRGSCSGGLYSEILESFYITFKRCALITKN